MAEVILWIAGFALLVGIAIYAASHHRKDQNAANRVIEKRNLKNTQSPESQRENQVRLDIEHVERLSPKEPQDG